MHEYANEITHTKYTQLKRSFLAGLSVLPILIVCTFDRFRFTQLMFETKAKSNQTTGYGPYFPHQ